MHLLLPLKLQGEDVFLIAGHFQSWNATITPWSGFENFCPEIIKRKCFTKDFLCLKKVPEEDGIVFCTFFTASVFMRESARLLANYY